MKGLYGYYVVMDVITQKPTKCTSFQYQFFLQLGMKLLEIQNFQGALNWVQGGWGSSRRIKG
jgi:hypothetical protein